MIENIRTTYPVSKKSAAKFERILHVNMLIETISKYGRRFFYRSDDKPIASMSIAPSGHIYFHDEYRGACIYVAYPGRWAGFSHGGTMRSLVEAMAHYVRTGNQLGIGWIGPERMNIADGNIWGYSEEEMKKCRAEALKNPAIKA